VGVIMENDYIIIDGANRVVNYNGVDMKAVITKTEINDGIYGSRTSSLTIELTCAKDNIYDKPDFVNVELRKAYEVANQETNNYLMIGFVCAALGFLIGLLILR
jgi:hypothetical protein